MNRVHATTGLMRFWGMLALVSHCVLFGACGDPNPNSVEPQSTPPGAQQERTGSSLAVERAGVRLEQDSSSTRVAESLDGRTDSRALESLTNRASALPEADSRGHETRVDTAGPSEASNPALEIAGIDLTPWLDARGRTGEDGATTTILLIGENHASVAAQKSLFSALGALHKGQKLDAILVEGTEGPLDPRPAAEHFGGDSGSLTREYALDSGMLAGFEVFALEHTDVPIHGIENMAAKQQFADDLTAEASMAATVAKEESLEACKVLTAAIAKLAPTDRPAAEAAMERFREASRRAGNAYDRFVQSAPPLLDLMRQEREILDSNGMIFQAMRRAYASDQGLDDAAVSNLIGEFGEARVDAAVKALQRLQDITKKADNLGDVAKGKELQVALADADNEYFVAANIILEASPSLWTLPEIRAVRTFFADQAIRSESRSDSQMRERLASRDSAMAANVGAFLSEKSPNLVVVIVGYAHVENLTERLSNLPHTRIVATVARGSLGRTAPWEMAAWERRRSQVEPLFSVAPDMKELSRLVDPTWLPEDRARTARHQSLLDNQTRPTVSGLADEGRIYETDIGGTVVATHLSTRRPNPVLLSSPHVRSHGPVIGRPGWYAVDYDRNMAEGLVKSLSTGEIMVVYMYTTLESGKPVRKLFTPFGILTAAEFRSKYNGAPKASGPSYIVAFAEPDTVIQDGVHVDRWKRYQSFEFQPEEFKGRAAPRILHTNDPEAAVDHAKALMKRKPDASHLKPHVVDLRNPDEKRVGPQGFFGQKDGGHSKMVIIVHENTGDGHNTILNYVEKAGSARLLENKSVVLITCGEESPEMRVLVNMILQYGALEVLLFDRRIPRDAADKLKTHADLAAEAGAESTTARGCLERIIHNWKNQEPNDPLLRYFEPLPLEESRIFLDRPRRTHKNSPFSLG